jgi:hypothetical protein
VAHDHHPPLQYLCHPPLPVASSALVRTTMYILGSSRYLPSQLIQSTPLGSFRTARFRKLNYGVRGTEYLAYQRKDTASYSIITSVQPTDDGTRDEVDIRFSPVIGFPAVIRIYFLRRFLFPLAFVYPHLASSSHFRVRPPNPHNLTRNFPRTCLRAHSLFRDTNPTKKTKKKNKKKSNMFFNGTLQEGISSALHQDKWVFCFVTGKFFLLVYRQATCAGLIITNSSG